MHILFVCSEYPYDHQPTGGFGTYVDNISQALIKAGHQVTIICQGEKEKVIDKGKIKIYVIKPVLNNFCTKIINTQSQFLISLGNFLKYPLGFSLRTAIILNRIISDESVQIIEGGDFGAELFFYLLFRKRKMPRVVIKFHTPSFVIREINNENNSFFYRVMKLFEIFCLNKADGLYSPTQSLIEKINRYIKRKITCVIPYPIPSNEEHRNTFRDKNLILYVGKLQTKKGVFTLIKSIPKIISKLPLIKFMLIGPDTYENNQSVKTKLIEILEKEQIKSKVTILDSISKQKLNSYYQQALITIVPSLWENFPNVLIEATLCRSIVIGSSIGGIYEIFKDFPDLLVSPGDSKRLASKITEVITLYPRYKTIMQKAQNSIIHRFNPNKIAADTVNFYDHVLKLKKLG